MYPVACFSYKLGLMVFNDPYQAGAIVGDWRFPLERLIQDAVNMGRISPETAFFLQHDLAQHIQDPQLWRQVAEQM